MNTYEPKHEMSMKYRPLLNTIYDRAFPDKTSLFIAGNDLAELVQQAFKVDTWIYHIEMDRQDNRRVISDFLSEEKVVEWPERNEPYTAFSLEEMSCTNPRRESLGWMKTCQAHYLLYAFVMRDTSLLAYLIDFPRLQDWYYKDYLPHLPRSDYGLFITNEDNHTQGRNVAIDLVIEHVSTRCFYVDITNACREIDLHCMDTASLVRWLLNSRHVNRNVALSNGVENANQVKCYMPRVEREV